MSLRERLTRAPGGDEIPDLIEGESSKGLNTLIGTMHFKLIAEMGADLERAENQARLRDDIERKLWSLLAQETAPLSRADKEVITRAVIDNVLGYGPIEPLLRDPTVTEIMVNNPSTVYVERFGRLYEADCSFIDEDHLRRIIDKIVGEVGRRIDESSPMVDARLPDGSRVNAIVHPLAINGPILTIRKFSQEPYTTEDLVGFGTLNDRLAALLQAAVKGRLNILISGGTGSGKTTLLNVVSSYLPADERIITIEDAAELKLGQDHVLRLEARPANIEGKGQITIRDLVRNSLRMRPDRIVVGEVRGGEALDMLQAMNTGHDGSLSTIHANTPRDALSRLETMVLMAGFDLPVWAIRQQVASALNLIVHLTRLRDGTRRVTHVSEIQGMGGETIILEDLFYFDYSAGVDEKGIFKGRLKSTGLRPKFARRLEDYGIYLPADTFQYDPPERA